MSGGKQPPAGAKPPGLSSWLTGLLGLSLGGLLVGMGADAIASGVVRGKHGVTVEGPDAALVGWLFVSLGAFAVAVGLWDAGRRLLGRKPGGPGEGAGGGGK